MAGTTTAEKPVDVASIPAGWARRNTVVALTFLACIIAYTDRVNISVAAVAMKEDLGWSQTQKGFVLSSFFIGYMLFMFASGWLATRFGGKRVLGVAVLAWSAFTLLTPPAAALSLTALIAVRIAMGIGEAAMFPASYELFGRWIPTAERTRAVARLLSGIPLGTLVGLMVTGWIITRYDWPHAFYFFGALGLLWAVVWFRSIEDDPSTDSRISAQERELLQRQASAATAAEKLPWRVLLLSKPVWSMVVAHFSTTWILYVLLAWLPSYFRDVQHLSIANAGLFSAAPWLAMFAVTNLVAPVADAMIRRGISVTFTRKLMQCAGLLLAAGFMLAARDIDSPALALALLCGAAGALGLTWAGYAPNSLDIAPRHAALLAGFSNTFATIPGIVGVAITGWLVDVTGTYAAAFVLTASVGAAGAIVYAIFFSARPLFAGRR
jgi:ACS family sodium-dependent inorganic phosphate cotransporter